MQLDIEREVCSLRKISVGQLLVERGQGQGGENNFLWLRQANAIAFSPDGRLLAVSGSAEGKSGVIKVWALTTDE